MPRRVIIEDVGNALNVQPACRHIRGNQYIDIAGFKTLKLAQAAALIHVAVDLAAGKTSLRKALVQIAHGGFAIGKNDRGFNQIIAQQPCQRIALLARFYRHFKGGDVFIRRCCARCFYPFRIVEKFLRQLFNRRRHSGRKQHRLTRFGKL